MVVVGGEEEADTDQKVGKIRKGSWKMYFRKRIMKRQWLKFKDI